MWRARGEAIRAARRAKGWTIEELAERAGLSERAVWEYERKNGSARPFAFVTLAQALGVEVSLISCPEAATAPAPKRAPNLSPETSLDRLDRLRDLEDEGPPAPARTDGVPPFTVRTGLSLYSAFAVHVGERYALSGAVARHRPVTDDEARLLGVRPGIAAKFLLLRMILGEEFLATVFVAKPEITRALQAARTDEVHTLVVRVTEADEAKGGGFASLVSGVPRPWALVAETLDEVAPRAGVEAAVTTAKRPSATKQQGAASARTPAEKTKRRPKR
jgi:transcriptional regulator with XRE-family HTH domain